MVVTARRVDRRMAKISSRNGYVVPSALSHESGTRLSVWGEEGRRFHESSKLQLSSCLMATGKRCWQLTGVRCRNRIHQGEKPMCSGRTDCIKVSVESGEGVRVQCACVRPAGG